MSERKRTEEIERKMDPEKRRETEGARGVLNGNHNELQNAAESDRKRAKHEKNETERKGKHWSIFLYRIFGLTILFPSIILLREHLITIYTPKMSIQPHAIQCIHFIKIDINWHANMEKNTLAIAHTCRFSYCKMQQTVGFIKI